MKYTINVNQKAVVRISPELDLKDAAILDWISIFANSGEMESIIHDGKLFFRISYPYLIEELPLLKINSKNGIYRRLKKLQHVGLLEPHPDNGRIIDENNGQQLSKVYWGFGPRYKEIHSSRYEKEGLMKFRGGVANNSEGGSDENATDTYTSSNHNTNIFSSSFAETHPKLYARLKSKKRGLEFIEHIVKVVDHFREVTGKTRTAYHTGGPLKYLLKWFKDGYTLEDVKLVIDYKTWYFTEKNPEPENISLATYLRFERFESNLENALAWKDAEVEAEESAPDPPTESELERYRLVMEYWNRCELSKNYTLTIEEFVQLVRGKSESKVVQKYASNGSWVNKEIRDAMNRLVSNNILSATAQNRSLKPLIEKNIDIYYTKTFK